MVDSPTPTLLVHVPGGVQLPSIIAAADERASLRFVEFFAANIRNPNTRAAYAGAVGQFLAWCEANRLSLDAVGPVAVSAYVELLMRRRSVPTVKQHLAAIRVLFDWLVVGQVVPVNPASSVRGPRYVVTTGKTPVLTAGQARQLLDSIDTGALIGLRDRALISTMLFSFARVGAVVGMNVEDFWRNGLRHHLRLREKGGRHRDLPAHHKAEEYLHAYVTAAGLVGTPRSPLFRSADGRTGTLTDRRMSRKDVLRMVKKRAAACDLPARTSCHSWRATGVTTYLLNGGTLEHAQAIAGHASPKTTKLYDRTREDITLDEIERINV